MGCCGAKPCRLEVAGRVEGLGVDDALRQEVLGDRLRREGEVLVLAKEAVLPDPGLDEMGEVPVAEPLLEGARVGDIRIAPVLLDQGPEGLERDCTLEVQVELDLWEAVEPVVGRHRAGILTSHVGWPSPPVAPESPIVVELRPPIDVCPQLWDARPGRDMGLAVSTEAVERFCPRE